MSSHRIGFPFTTWAMLAVWLLSGVLGACRPDATSPPLLNQVQYTTGNFTLHGGVLSAVNYRDGETPVPVGTAVRVTQIDSESITVATLDNASSFRFAMHKAWGSDVERAFASFFSPTAPTEALAQLPEPERTWVQNSNVQPGMHKAAVLLAIGPPPPHRTPDLRGQTWTYWKSRSRTFKVQFDMEGKVTQVEGLVAPTPAPVATPAPAPTPPAAERMYARCNVHFEGTAVSWVNYQRGPILPINTEVEVVSQRKTSVVFRDTKTGVTYTFKNDEKASGTPTWALFERLFAPEDQAAALQAFSATEQQQIRGAQAEVKMTRAAVQMALCPPPPHQTPSLDSKQWLYWLSRFNRIKIVFDEAGTVAAIET